MTRNKAEKAAIRQRMAETGEPYSVARRVVASGSTDSAASAAGDSDRKTGPHAIRDDNWYASMAADAGISVEFRAQVFAVDAQERADAAQERADQAQHRAEQAQEAADIAQEAADMAQEAADLSWAGERETGQRQANAAQAAADEAQRRADRMQADADRAQEVADQVQDAADQVQDAADAATEAAEALAEDAADRVAADAAAGPLGSWRLPPLPPLPPVPPLPSLPPDLARRFQEQADGLRQRAEVLRDRAARWLDQD